MGSFNAVCQISHRSISYLEECVIIFTLKSNSYKTKDMIVYNTDNYHPVSLPFYVKYTDYGQYILNPKYQFENKIAFNLFKTSAQVSVISMTVDPELRKLINNENQLKAMSRAIYKNDQLTQFLNDVTFDTFEELFSKFESNSENISYMAFNQNVFENLVTPKLNQPVSQYNSKLGEYEILPNLLTAVTEYYESYNPIKFTLTEFERPLQFELISIGNQNTMSDSLQRWFYKMVKDYAKDSKKDSKDVIRVFLSSRIFYEALIELKIPYGQAIYGGQQTYQSTLAAKLLGELECLRKDFEEEFEWNRDFITYDEICMIKPEFYDKVSKDEFKKLPLDKLLKEIGYLSNETILKFYNRKIKSY